jgi:hypothetical protein
MQQAKANKTYLRTEKIATRNAQSSDLLSSLLCEVKLGDQQISHLSIS